MTMSKLISCQFNIDTACVELVFDEGSQLSIDCTAVENEVVLFQRLLPPVNASYTYC